MKIALILAGVLAATLVAGPAAATSVDTSPNKAIEWPGSEANHTGYWQDYFEGDTTCLKVENSSDSGSYKLPTRANRLVIKQGQMNFVWVGAVAGRYAGPYSQPGGEGGPGWSHAFRCYTTPPIIIPPVKPPTEPPFIDITKVKVGAGRILGPCGDPYYTARIKNRAYSSGPIAFVLKANGKLVWKKVLKPGQTAKPKPRWFKGGVKLVLKRGNGKVYDREVTITGTFPWTECRNG